MKKALIVINPFSGTKKANRFLTDIADMLAAEGYLSIVVVTQKSGDGEEQVKRLAEEVDLVVAIGGDGTFTEVVSGLIASGKRVPIGYIPSGSTNDLAQSLNISRNIMDAAKNIVSGKPAPLDVGQFNDRIFSYVASFGAFTKASYSTPQNVKNALGHLAYILEGLNSLTNIKAEHIKIVSGDKVYEDDYIFGAITNATSMGGILKLDPEVVDMSDGLLEMLLVKSPKDFLELTEIIHVLTMQDFDNTDKVIFVGGEHFEIEAPADMSWSLDGEYQEGCEKITIVNRHHAIDLINK